MFTANQQDQAGGEQVELVLNLQHSRRASAVDASAARSRAQALVVDVLKSRLDVETEAGPGSFLRARGFTDVGKALAASRALQLAFEGFRSTAAGARTNISVMLDSLPPQEALSRNFSPSAEQRELFGLARSSRILITQALYDRATACQPLALRSFPPRAGVYEFLWTSAERLQELQTETDFTTEPALEQEPFPTDIEATVIQRPVTNPRIPVKAEPVEPMPVPERPVARVYAEDEEPVAKRSRFWAVALSCAAAVLLAVGGLMFWRPGQATPVPQPAPTAHTEVPPATPAAEPPASPPVEESVPKPILKTTRSDSGPRATPLPVQKKAVDPKPPLKAKNEACSTEVSGSVSYYLGLADKNRNRGNLDDAEREYQQVIDCEPNNHDARQGLVKVRADRNSN